MPQPYFMAVKAGYPVNMTDDELELVLTALETLQATQMREHRGVGEPPLDVPEGEYVRAGILHLLLTEEAMRRALALRDAVQEVMEK